MSFPATFKVGDHVRVARRNQEAQLPDGCPYVGEFDPDLLGKEFVLTNSHEYDVDDNTWDVDVEYKGDFDSWIHEGALEYVVPLTQEDEDAAIASILKATAPKHLPLTEDGYRRNAEDCPACIPVLDKMAYPFICPGPQEEA